MLVGICQAYSCAASVSFIYCILCINWDFTIWRISLWWIYNWLYCVKIHTKL